MMPLNEVACQLLLEQAPDAMVAADQAGLIVFANQQAERMFEFPRQELLGQALNVIVSTPCEKFLSVGGARGGQATRACPLDLACVRKGGGEFPAEVAHNRVETSIGPLLLLAIRDVTAQRQAEEAIRARARQPGLVADLGRRALAGIGLHLLMDEAVRMTTAELETDCGSLLELLPEGRVEFRAGVGWPEGMAGKLVVELRAGTPAGQVVLDQVPVIVEDLRVDNRFPGAFALRERGVVSSLSFPLHSQGRPLGVLGVHTTRPRSFSPEDLHFVQAVANVVSTAMEQHRQEQRLNHQAMRRAEQMAAIGQVAAGVAHELRNPLTSIKGLIQVNLREAAELGPPPEDLVVIEHEIRRMERTLQTFLDFARPPQPDRRRLDLTSVVDRVFALVGGRARKQGVRLRVVRLAAPAWVNADQDQIQQLLLNLILNALDAMPTEGAIEVEIRPPQDGTVEVRVCDTGPGIAPHILPQVFETFVSSKETGVGLGLPVSQRIAEDHGGTLSAYNQPDSGACFVLRLPAPESS